MTTKTDPNQNYTINEFYIKVKGDYGKEKTVRVNDMGDKLLSLITDLGWDYQRMSMSGRQSLTKYINFLVRLKKMKFIWRFKNDYTRVKLETQSFTYVSRNTGKEELVNLNENQLNSLREFYVERFVDNMEIEDLVQYVTDDMMRYMEALPDNEVIDECLNYWDDMFDEVIEEVKEFEQCDFKALADKKDDLIVYQRVRQSDYGSKVVPCR